MITRLVELAVAFFVWKTFPKASDDEIVAFNNALNGAILDPLGIANVIRAR